jgi:hypothetical protein
VVFLVRLFLDSLFKEKITMMLKKKVLAAALGAMMISSSAFAVELAPAGKGDLLIAPFFMTAGGWQTELKVINTNTTDSAVAKVVFHAPDNSAEILDFLIFLSPGDVWTGKVVTNADGSIGVTSDDDSSIVTTTLANKCPDTTGSVGFDPTRAKFTVPVGTGYVTIFETRMIRGLGAAPVAKSAILASYSASCTAAATAGVSDLVNSSTDNVLTGSVTLRNPSSQGDELSLPMTALANYNNYTYHSVGALTAFANNAAGSTKAQVEDAIWASNFVIPYNNAAGQYTYGIVTFPTKETYNGSAATQYSAFGAGAGSPTVSYAVRNEQENVLGTVGCSFSPCAPGSTLRLPNEVNLVSIATGGSISSSTNALVYTQTYTKGWVNADIQTEASDTPSNVNYNNFGMMGAPALTSYLIWNATSGGLKGAWMYSPATFTPGAY